MTKTIPEILHEVAETGSYKDRVKILQENESKALRTILQHMFHPDVKFDVEIAKDLKHDNMPTGHNYSNLHGQSKKFYIFYEDSNVRPARKDEILYEICLSLGEEEAKLFVDVLTKNSTDWKYVTENLVRKAFPDLLPEEEDETDESEEE